MSGIFSMTVRARVNATMVILLSCFCMRRYATNSENRTRVVPDTMSA